MATPRGLSGNDQACWCSCSPQSEFYGRRLNHRTVQLFKPPTLGWSWELPSPGILCIAVVDIFRDGIVLKEVCKLALEVRTESLHQPRPWERIEETTARCWERGLCLQSQLAQQAEAELFQVQGQSGDPVKPYLSSYQRTTITQIQTQKTMEWPVQVLVLGTENKLLPAHV